MTRALAVLQAFSNTSCTVLRGELASEEVISGVADDVGGAAFLGCASGSSLRLRLSPLRLEARVRPTRSPLTSALLRPADGALWFGTADGSLLQLSTRSRIFFGLAEQMVCRGSECSPSTMPPPPPLPLRLPPSPAPLPAPPPPSLLPLVPTPTQSPPILQQPSFQLGGETHTQSPRPQASAGAVSASVRFDHPDTNSLRLSGTPALWISQRTGVGMTIVLVRSASLPCPCRVSSLLPVTKHELAIHPAYVRVRLRRFCWELCAATLLADGYTVSGARARDATRATL